MFDIGFTELLVIGVVALIVIGPERLPKVARTAGLLFGRLQRYVSQVKSDINQEMQLDELKRMRAQLEESVAKTDFEIVEEVRKVETTVTEAAGEVKGALAPPQHEASVAPESQVEPARPKP